MNDFEKNVAASLTGLHTRIARLEAAMTVTAMGVQHLTASDRCFSPERRAPLVVALTQLKNTPRPEQHPAYTETLNSMLEAWIAALTIGGD